MANHQSAKKRIRQNDKKRVANRYSAVSTRNAIRDLRNSSEKPEAEVLFPKVSSMLDKLAKKNIIHKKKASNLKASLQKHVSSL
ncbi:MAG: 30S ribosomal protein S20 [Bacteroidetes bacterium 4572_117]|nr:MAG: 30S ribosomal protein S20 [Bacteroidetes bacterium 4572_117]